VSGVGTTGLSYACQARYWQKIQVSRVPVVDGGVNTTLFLASFHAANEIREV
jgi:hypothetical protein